VPEAEPAQDVRLAEVVVVTATRSERSSRELPLSTTVLTREAIVRAPALLSDDLLRGVPGVDLPTGNSTTLFPTNNTASMRGLGGSRALVLLDGVPLNDGFFGHVQWNQVPLQGVETVEIVRGGGASLFGNYSMGGTIQILTTPVLRRQGNIDALGGAQGTWRLNGSASERLGPNTAIGLNAGYFDTDGSLLTVPEDRTRLDVPHAATQLSLRLKLEHEDASGRRGNLRASWSADDQSLGTALSGFERDMLNLAASGRMAAGGSGRLRAGLFFQNQNFDVDNTATTGGGDTLGEYVANSNHTPIRDLGGFVQWDREWAGALRSLTAGIDVRRVEGQNESTTYDEAGSAVGFQDSGGTQRFVGLFAEASVHPAERVELLVGARLDRWDNYDGSDRTEPGATTRFEEASSLEVNPRVALRFTASEVLTLRAAAYRSFRAPTLNELYRSFLTKRLAVFSSPDLGPETSRGGEIGLEARNRRVAGQFTLFRNDVEDLISRTAVRNGPRPLTFRFTNLGTIRSQGLEAFGRAGLAHKFTVDASYTFTHSTVRDNPTAPAFVGNRVPLVPRHQASLSFGFHDPARGSASVRARALGNQFADAANLNEMDAHVVVDLFASVSLGQRFEVYVVGENVFDEEYLADLGAARRLGAPRQFMAGLRLRVFGER
jgi:outer membrane receptor protein involved in Fe transport